MAPESSWSFRTVFSEKPDPFSGGHPYLTNVLCDVFIPEDDEESGGTFFNGKEFGRLHCSVALSLQVNLVRNH